MVIDGTINMPAHEQRIASRNVSLLQRGLRITGDDAVDNASAGGGPPDGGIWLAGAFHFEIDARGQSTDASWVSIFGMTQASLTGGVYGNGEIHMFSSHYALGISGLLKNGVVTGYATSAGERIDRGDDVWNRLPLASQNYLRGIWEGDQLQFLHGRMAGTGVLR